MAYDTAAGTIISVSTEAPATYDVVGFEALTYDAVGEVTSIPEHGAEYTLVTHNPIADRITRKLKGSVNYGSLTLPMALDTNDAGQITMRDHSDGTKIDDPASFKVEWPDGSIEFFTALVMSFRTAGDGVDSILAASAQIEIDNSIIDG